LLFVVSKIGWALLSPLSLVLVLFILGTACALLSLSRTGLFFFFVAIFIYIVLGLLPVGPDLVATLENKYVRPDKVPEQIAGIVVLGGSFETELSEKRGLPIANARIERVLEGLRLAKMYPKARLVFSGGEASLIPQNHPESKDVASFIKLYGFEVEQPVAYESKSRNTLENMKFTRDLVTPKPGENWLLVTSAFHMQRAMKAAEEAGWKDIIPYPTDYRTDGEMAEPVQMLNVSRNFYLSDMALHEYAGMLAYDLGKRFQAK
jgi:uncharacterized SAM-binding protein YcdF (DUF218 family)